MVSRFAIGWFLNVMLISNRNKIIDSKIELLINILTSTKLSISDKLHSVFKIYLILS